MNNGIAKAQHWTSFLASRAYIPSGDLLLAHFAAGTVTRFCDCGCNSYEISVDPVAGLNRLSGPSTTGGCVLSLAFKVSGRDDNTTLEFGVHVDTRGCLSGLDVDFCANSFPVPDVLTLVEPPFHIYGTLVA